MYPASLFTRGLQEKAARARAQPALQMQQQQREQQAQAAAAAAAAVTAAAAGSSAAAHAPPSAESVETELAVFSSLLASLSAAHASASQREEHLFSFFHHLRSASSPAQIRALDLLGALVDRRPSVILGCSNLLALLLRVLQSAGGRSDSDVSESATAIYCKLAWLLSSTASEHMTVRELKRIFRILRRVVERKSPPLLCRLMLSSLADMASNSAPGQAVYVSPTANQALPLPRAPSACFDLSGTQSALALPPMEKWPCNKGYAVCMWVRWESEAKPVAADPGPIGSSSAPASRGIPIAMPVPRGGLQAMQSPLQAPPPLAYLYSFLTDKARGIEALVGKHTGHIVVRSVSRGVLHELNTKITLPDKKWAFLAICHKKPQTFSRSSGTVNVYVNDECKYEGELSYPALTEPLIYNAFAAATHPSKPSAPLLGRLSTISFHTRTLTPAQVQLLYRGGADFCIRVLNQIDRSNKLLSFVSDRITSLLGAISSAATQIAQHNASPSADEEADKDEAASGGDSNSGKRAQAEANKELFKNLLCLYHPRCVEGHLALDCSPLSSASAVGVHTSWHASILPGVQLCSSRDIRDLLHLAIGGITAFFPLFQHADVLSPRHAPSGAGAASKGKDGAHGRKGSHALFGEPTSPTRLRSHSSILSLLFRTLQLMLRGSPSNQLTFLQCSGFQMVSFLLLKYTSPYHLSEALLVSLEQMLQELSWGPSLAKLQSQVAPAADDRSTSPSLESMAAPTTTGASAAEPSAASAHTQRQIDMMHTNHNLPVSRAAEKTLYNDCFLHLLFNFSLWFRTPTLRPQHQHQQSDSSGGGGIGGAFPSASAALDDLSQQQVSFSVQFELLLLIKSHVLKNPRYFRRLLSAGGGGGAAANAAAAAAANGSGGAAAWAHYTHLGAASAGPVKFILDNLRRFLTYQGVLDQYAQASSLLSRSASPSSSGSNGPTTGSFHPFLADELVSSIRHLRALRQEWLGLLRSLMLCGVGSVGDDVPGSPTPSAPIIRETDITALVQIICEVSDASASSASASESAASSSSSSAPASSSAYSWVLSEYLAFLQSIFLRRPDELMPMLQRAGGCQLWVSILARNVRFQHVQLSVIHLLTCMSRHAMSSESKLHGEFMTQLGASFPALQTALDDCYLTVPTYQALMELLCGLAPASLMATPRDGAEQAIDMFCLAAQRLTGGEQQDAEEESKADESAASDLYSLAHASSSPPGPHYEPSLSASPPPPDLDGASAPLSPAAPSSSLPRSATIKLPRGIELIHALLQNNETLRIRERLKMKERWQQEAVKLAQQQHSYPSAAGDAASAPTRAASPSSSSARHRASDNIHWDESVESPNASARRVSRMAPFTVYHPFFHPSLHASALPTLLPAPLLPFSTFISDIQALLNHAPSNCAKFLNEWPIGISVLLRLFDWRAVAQPQPTAANAPPIQLPPSVSDEIPQLVMLSPGTAEELAIADKLVATTPDRVGMIHGLDMDSLLPPLVDERRTHGSIDEFIIASQPSEPMQQQQQQHLSSRSHATSPSTSPSLSAPSTDDHLHALSQQQLLADLDLADSDSSSPPLSQLAFNVVETLLTFAVVHMRDGWTHWRSTLLLLRIEAERQQLLQEDEAGSGHGNSASPHAAGSHKINEESFRTLRRNLLVSLLRRLEQLPAGSASISGSAGTVPGHLLLHLNLAHIIELVEEMLYFDAARFKHFTMREVEANEGPLTDTSAAAIALARKRSRIDSVTKSQSTSSSSAHGSAVPDSWVLMDEEETHGDGPSLAHHSTTLNPHSPTTAAAAAHPSAFRAEWRLVRQLLQCLRHLQFSLQPVRFTPSVGSASLMAATFGIDGNAGGASVSLDAGASLSMQAMSSGPTGASASSPAAASSATFPLRTGGPLRIVIRLLLDCCSAVCFSSEGLSSEWRDVTPAVPDQSPSSDSCLTQLQDVVSQLGALVHVELAVPGPIAFGQRVGTKSAAREWNNRHVLHILWRLCQIMRVLPAPSNARAGSSSESGSSPIESRLAPTPSAQMRRILHSTINQVVEQLGPFAVAPLDQFEQHEQGAIDGGAGAANNPTDKSVYVPLVVEEGFLDIDPSFQLIPTADHAPPFIASPAYSRVLRCCHEYIAASVQLWHSMQHKFAAECSQEAEARERAMRRKLKESGLLEAGGQKLLGGIDTQRSAWRTVQTLSYAESNRRAVVDSFYSDHVLRVSDQWRSLAHALYSEGSAWCSSEIAQRRKLYQLDNVEDGIEHARTVQMAKEKAEKAKQQRRAQLPPSTPKPQLPPAATLHASISSPALSLSHASSALVQTPQQPLSAGLERTVSTPSPTPSPSVIESKEDGGGNNAPASAPSTAEPDASVDAARLQRLASSLGSSLKRVGEGEDEADEAEVDEGEEQKEDAESNKNQRDDEDEPGGTGGQTAEDRLTSLPRQRSESGQSDASASSAVAAGQPAEEWDMCEVATNPLGGGPSSGSASASASASLPSAIYTSPMCTLVLPIGTVYGTLEISAHAIKFAFNPHAEQQILQQQLIQAEQMARQQALEDGRESRPLPPPGPKSKPFTLPSLDAWRVRARKDRVWPLGSIVAVYRRRYQLQKTALEIFLLNGRNFFIDLGSRAERKTVLRKILAVRPPRLIRLCSRSVNELLARSRLTEKWLAREMSNFEYLMHLNTCLSSSTLVAVADGRNLRADELTLDMRLYGPTGAAIAIKSIQTAFAPFMIRIVTDQGQHDVTPNHLVTLRFAHNPSVHMDEADSVPHAYCKVQWWDKRDLRLRQHRFPCAKLPSDLSGREREFATWWLERAERDGTVFPLRRGDLFEVRADALLTMNAQQDDFMQNVSIPMAHLAHERAPSLPVAPSAGALVSAAAASPSSPTAASQRKCPCATRCVDADNGLLGAHDDSPCDAIGTGNDLAELVAAFLVETPAEDDEAVKTAMATSSHTAATTPAAQSVGLHECPQYTIPTRQSAAGEYGYEQLAADDGVDVVYLLPSSLGPQSTGQKAYTFLQLERAWDVLAIDPSQARVAITDLNPMDGGLIDESESRQAAHESVCAATMSAVILAVKPAPSVIVVFGQLSGERWASTEFVRAVPGVAHAGPVRRDSETEVVTRSIVSTRGATITIVFAPHPSAGWLFSNMLAALCRAHRLPFDPALLHANPVAKIQSIERVGADHYVAIEVDSADQRFVLSDSLCTHNCSGRSYNDINQYPVFPWIIAHYPEPKVKLVPNSSGSGSSSGSGLSPLRGVEVPDEGVDNIDVEEVIRAGPSHKYTSRVFRDLTKPMGAIDEARLAQVLERFSSFFDSTIPPFHYGSHYSNAAIVLFYLMRLEPYASLHIELQGGKFDWSDRLFSSMAQTWKNCCTSLSCYKELTPEFFYNPDVLDNVNGYDLGIKQDGQVVGNVALPTWAHDSSAEFIRINRLALESEYVSLHLHSWIDLIFGYKQKGAAAKDAHNLFYYLTYEGAVDMATVKDPVLLEAIREQIAQFGQTPVQMFKKPHPARQPLASAKLQRLSLSSTLAHMLEQNDYHHPPLRRVLVSPDRALLSIRALPSKLLTVSSGFVLALHLWLPDTSSDVEDPPVGAGADVSSPMQGARRHALPFTWAVAHTTQLPKHNPVLSDACIFSLDGRLLLEGNLWNHSMRVYQVGASVHGDALRHRERGLGSAAAGSGAAPHIGELKLVLSQNLIQHRDRITCMSLGRDDKTLVTGSSDCTLLVWSLDVEEPTSRVSGMFKEGELCVRPGPRHILRGHEDAIIGVAVDSEMDACVSVSSRGQVLMHSIRKGSFVMHIHVPTVAEVQAKQREAHARAIANATAAAIAATNGGAASSTPIPSTSLVASSSSSSSSSHLPGSGTSSPLSRSRTGSVLESALSSQAQQQSHLAKLVSFAADGCLVFYSVTWDASARRFLHPQLSCCSLNARHWRAVALEEYLQCMAVSGDGRLLATGSEGGMLVLRRLHDLKVVQRFEPLMASITSIAFSYEQEYIFVGTSHGHMVIYAVSC